MVYPSRDSSNNSLTVFAQHARKQTLADHLDVVQVKSEWRILSNSLCFYSFNYLFLNSWESWTGHQKLLCKNLNKAPRFGSDRIAFIPIIRLSICTFNCFSRPDIKHYYPHFAQKKSEVECCEEICPSPHRKLSSGLRTQVVKLNFSPRNISLLLIKFWKLASRTILDLISSWKTQANHVTRRSSWKINETINQINSWKTKWEKSSED